MCRPQAKNDVETGNNADKELHPVMLESPQMRWAFIRKVYSILAFQLLLTGAIAAVVVLVRPISVFFTTTIAGIVLHVVLVLSPLIILWPLFYYHKKHPLNFFLLALFTITLSFGVGLSWAKTKGSIILEAAILTTVVVVSLTLYTFWAARRGQDFNFLGPFLFASLLVILAFALIQIFSPLDKLSRMIYGGLVAIVFCGYIVYDTNDLIKRCAYDEYIWASVSLYLDIVNLFSGLVTFFTAVD
ncbi:hypothetical protein Vadar_000829 [Vaccinium darrowii]|uniref:Uncharacterized protein n=1 Tax=Vaccinium darrowii TaxID=229202 RepID=A0ACB7Z944_9ERIC|nr:hypothetical protein Vadar_000829 [Vaccinium darrowii]